jgi:ABC-type transporter Mla maintaining outer membrane lipid asymmetry ATPase subunit MlaF
MVSRDFDQVRRIADRVTVLDRLVVAEGSPDLLAAEQFSRVAAAAARARSGAAMMTPLYS